MWPVLLLRMLASLVITILYIPMMKTFLASFSCDSVPFICAQNSIAVFATIAGVCLAVLVPFCFLIVLSYFDPNPKSENAFAKSHTYLDMVLLFAKAVNSVVATVVSDLLAVSIVFLILQTISVAAAFLMQPYYHSWMNRLVCNCASLFSPLSLPLSHLVFECLFTNYLCVCLCAAHCAVRQHLLGVRLSRCRRGPAGPHIRGRDNRLLRRYAAFLFLCCVFRFCCSGPPGRMWMC